MTAQTLFAICTKMVLPAWALLLIAPRWKWTRRIVGSGAPVALLGAVYAFLILKYYPSAPGGFGSLSQVARVFQTPEILVAGWIHYLTFDLLAGSWEVEDSQRLGISHWLVAPCLVLTMMFGPIGFGCYFLLRWVVRGKKAWRRESYVSQMAH